MLPTGTGKTIISGAIISDFIERTKRRVLFLNHRIDLVEQTDKKLRRMGLEPEIEMGERKADSRPLYAPDVVVGSIQSMQRGRLDRWDRKHFGCIIVDEVHHVVSQQYRNLLEHFEGYKLLGVSATYDRSDRKSLGDFFTETDRPVYEFPLFDAIELGYLCRLEVRRIKTGIDLKKVKRIAGQKDVSLEEVAERLTPMITNLVRDVIIPECGERQTIVFAPDVRTAEAFAACLNSCGRGARAVSSFDSTEWRAESLKLFRDREIQYLANFGIFGEGFDEPQISAGVGARPTTSRPLYAQMVGRILRTHEESGKRDAVWVDLAMNSSGLSLVHPADIFATSRISQEALEETRRMIDHRGAGDLCEAVREAVEADRSRDVRRLVVEASNSVPKLSYTRTTFDPIGVRTCGLVRFTRSDNLGPRRASEKQCEMLRKFKVRQPELLGRRGASKLLGAVLDRAKMDPSEKGSATYAQINLLTQRGVPEREAISLSREEATDRINRILGGRNQRAFSFG